MRQFDRRLAYHFDWLVVLLTLAVAGIGLVTIYSATVASEHNGSFTTNPLVIRQAFYAGIGLVGMIAAVFFDYRRLERYAYVVYVLALLMLVAVPVMGSVGGGARRWINLGFVSVQPSEMIKVALVDIALLASVMTILSPALTSGGVPSIFSIPAASDNPKNRQPSRRNNRLRRTSTLQGRLTRNSAVESSSIAAANSPKKRICLGPGGPA